MIKEFLEASHEPLVKFAEFESDLKVVGSVVAHEADITLTIISFLVVIAF